MRYKYTQLIPQVKEQLEVVTDEVAEAGATVFDMGLSVIDSQLERAEDELVQEQRILGAFSMAQTYPRNTSLRKKVNDLQQAKDALVTAKRC